MQPVTLHRPLKTNNNAHLWVFDFLLVLFFAFFVQRLINISSAILHSRALFGEQFLRFWRLWRSHWRVVGIFVNHSLAVKLVNHKLVISSLFCVLLCINSTFFHTECVFCKTSGRCSYFAADDACSVFDVSFIWLFSSGFHISLQRDPFCCSSSHDQFSCNSKNACNWCDSTSTCDDSVNCASEHFDNESHRIMVIALAVCGSLAGLGVLGCICFFWWALCALSSCAFLKRFRQRRSKVGVQ